MNTSTKKIAGIGQIILLISFAFAVSFMMSEYVGVGSAQTGESLSPNPSGNSKVVANGPLSLTNTPKPPIVPAPTGADIVALSPHKFQFGDKVVDGFISQGDSRFGILSDGTKVQFEGDSWKAIGGSSGGTGAAGGAGSYEASIGGLPLGSGGVGFLLEGLVWAGIVYGGIQLVGGLLGLDPSTTDALSLAASGGVMAYSLWSSLGPTGFGAIGAEAAALAPWIGIGVGVAIFVLTYEETKTEIVQFECLPYEAPYGGNNCELCNEDPAKPCSEYRCKSLGQACEIINKGSEEEQCIWTSKNDVTGPIIEPDEEALTKGLEYVKLEPNGYRIEDPENKNKCLTPFSAFTFGVKANEPAKCREDLVRTENFDDMTYPFGNSQLFRSEHKQLLPVSNPFAEEENGGEFGKVVHNNGITTLYVRCVDGNGNGGDSKELAFSFCTDSGPDKRPPTIMETSLPSGSPIRSGAGETPYIIYVNEPSQCRWSHQNRDYDAMENQMECASNQVQFNANFNYPCSTTLTGIIDKIDNNFYFACVDLKGNKMPQTYPMVLKGTEPLTIDSTGPKGLVQGSTSSVGVTLSVTTSHGANQGKAICGYSEDREDIEKFVNMQNTNDYVHNQTIFRPTGNYTYYFRCSDGANTAVANTTFSVYSDTAPPKVTRIYRDGGSIKLITDEEANCAYSTTNCDYSFEDGLPMNWENGNKMKHLTTWDDKVTYYIKCQDMRGKGPTSPNACQVIVQGSEF